MFSLIVLSTKVFCYRQTSKAWQLCLLDGEDAFLLSDGSQPLLKELANILHDAAAINKCEIHVLFKNDSPAKLFAAEVFLEAVKLGFHQTQLIALEPLTKAAKMFSDNADGASEEQSTWCSDVLLPLLDASLFSLGVLLEEKKRLENTQDDLSLKVQLDRAQQSIALKQAHDDAKNSAEEVLQLQEVVRQQKQLLIELNSSLTGIQGQLDKQTKEYQHELALLQARLANASSQPSQEIIRFMPVFFRNFWEKIRPDEMAQLLGMEHVPTIAVPYPEPGPDVVAVLRQQFHRLPESTKLIILNWVRDLSHNWDIRQEMLYLLETK